MPSRSSHKNSAGPTILITTLSLTLVSIFLCHQASAQTYTQTYLDNLNKEIASYQNQIDALSGQADSLSSTIKSYQLTRKKLADDIKLTDNKISGRTLEIQGLSSNIDLSQQNIDNDKRIIAKAFSTISESDSNSLVEIILGNDSISGVLDSLTKIGTIQGQLLDRISSFKKNKATLESTKKATEKARADLQSLNRQKKDQQAIIAATAAQQNSILKDTKQSEAAYQKTLAEKLQLKNAFEQEMLTYQSHLTTKVDETRIPTTGAGVLAWPLDDIHITQYFGNTSFSTANPQIYNGHGHTGVDFRASIGTPIKAALSGIVLATGNTDIVPGCYSYGKWVMVKHYNGLSTLYAHLSLPIVSAGTAVATGQIIGYSGNTGYTTGPHLHFGVYASQGVTIQALSSSKNCHNAIMPIAPFSAYLNPLSYLP